MEILSKRVEGFQEAERAFRGAMDNLGRFVGKDVVVSLRGTLYDPLTDKEKPFTRTTVVQNVSNTTEIRKRYMSLIRDELESQGNEDTSPDLAVYSDSVDVDEYAPPPPPPAKQQRPEIWERNTFGGYVRVSTRGAYENAATFVKRKGRWYKKTRTSWIQAEVKFTRWGYRLSSAAEKKRNG